VGFLVGIWIKWLTERAARTAAITA
jgi:hypothetical protein